MKKDNKKVIPDYLEARGQKLQKYQSGRFQYDTFDSEKFEEGYKNFQFQYTKSEAKLNYYYYGCFDPIELKIK